MIELLIKPIIEPIRLSWLKLELQKLFKCGTSLVYFEQDKKLEIELYSYFSFSYSLSKFISLKDLIKLSDLIQNDKIFICEGINEMTSSEDRDEFKLVKIKILVEGIELI